MNRRPPQMKKNIGVLSWIVISWALWRTGETVQCVNVCCPSYGDLILDPQHPCERFYPASESEVESLWVKQAGDETSFPPHLTDGVSSPQSTCWKVRTDSWRVCVSCLLTSTLCGGLCTCMHTCMYMHEYTWMHTHAQTICIHTINK